MKRVISVVLVCLFLFALVGCGENNKSSELAGQYKNVLNGNKSLLLNEDGTFEDSGDTGKWTAGGKKVTLTYADGEKYELEMQGDYLYSVDYIMAGPEAPESGTWAGVYTSALTTVELFSDGTYARELFDNKLFGNYRRDGDVVYLYNDESGIDMGHLIVKGGITDSALVKE